MCRYNKHKSVMNCLLQTICYCNPKCLSDAQRFRLILYQLFCHRSRKLCNRLLRHRTIANLYFFTIPHQLLRPRIIFRLVINHFLRIKRDAIHQLIIIPVKLIGKVIGEQLSVPPVHAAQKADNCPFRRHTDKACKDRYLFHTGRAHDYGNPTLGQFRFHNRT